MLTIQSVRTFSTKFVLITLPDGWFQIEAALILKKVFGGDYRISISKGPPSTRRSHSGEDIDSNNTGKFNDTE